MLNDSFNDKCRSKLLKVVRSVKHIRQALSALKYIELARDHVKDNGLCNDLITHLYNKYPLGMLTFTLGGDHALLGDNAEAHIINGVIVADSCISFCGLYRSADSKRIYGDKLKMIINCKHICSECLKKYKQLERGNNE